MWPWRKKVKPVRQKRKPREWSFPVDSLPEILALYDDMMSSTYSVGSLIRRRTLPRYTFWKRVGELIPDADGLSAKIEDVGDCRCIKLVEVVADDDYEPEPTETTKKMIGSIETIAHAVNQV